MHKLAPPDAVLVLLFCTYDLRFPLCFTLGNLHILTLPWQLQLMPAAWTHPTSGRHQLRWKCQISKLQEVVLLVSPRAMMSTDRGHRLPISHRCFSTAALYI